MIFNEHTNKLLKAFYTITGIKIVVMDTQFNEIYSQPPVSCDFCEKKQRSENSGCDRSTKTFCERCRNIDGLYAGKCYAGLFEAVFPLKNGHLVVGYIMFGQVRDAEEDCGAEYKGVTVKTAEQLDAALEILQTLAQYIMLKDIIDLNKDEPGIRIAEYIQEHLSEDLSVSALMRKFAICKNELYNVTAPFMPGGVGKYIKKLRMDKAMELLKNSDLSVRAVSKAVGYTDYYYFGKDFKKRMGVTAGEYRKNHMKK